MNIDELQPGHELHRLIAEKVMGWTLDGHNAHFGTPVWRCSDHLVGGYSTWHEYTFSPGFSIADAWLVVEKAFPVGTNDKSGFPSLMHRSDGWLFTLVLADGSPMELFGGGRLLLAKAETAPLAICRAALKAIGS